MRILYGVVGEGMGHATRSKVAIEHLQGLGHEVKVVVSGRAYAFLRKHFDDVVEIRGLTLHYENGAMSRDISVLKNMLVAPGLLLANAKAYLKQVAAFDPHLCISDFDSFSHLFAKRHSLPVISIDNQQIIHKCKHDDEIKKGLRPDFHATRAFVKAKLPGCDHYVITSFFEADIREKFKDRTTLVPPILRAPILEARARLGEYVLVYQTSQSDVSLLPTLGGLRDRQFVLYGRGVTDAPGNVTMKEFSEEGFVDDLASARAVITNGGLSLIGEAIYLGKPILSVPVRHQFEQEMNARYVQKLGYGVAAKKLDTDVIERFLRDDASYAREVRRYRQKGNEVLYATLKRLLKEYR